MAPRKIIANVVDIQSPWLSHKDLKKYLGGVSDEWVHSRIWPDKFIDVKKVDKKIFYVKAQIDRFIDRHKLL